jgi:hypothetical protein
MYDIPETGLSTLSPQIAEMHRATGRGSQMVRVPSLTLDDLFALAGPRDIHWLKIDVEGCEPEVFGGWKTRTMTPWVVCVECTAPNSTVSSTKGWEEALVAKDYKHVYFDGLNRFYVHRSRTELATHFDTPPNVFDGTSYSSRNILE